MPANLNVVERVHTMAADATHLADEIREETVKTSKHRGPLLFIPTRDAVRTLRG